MNKKLIKKCKKIKKIKNKFFFTHQKVTMNEKEFSVFSSLTSKIGHFLIFFCECQENSGSLFKQNSIFCVTDYSLDFISQNSKNKEGKIKNSFLWLSLESFSTKNLSISFNFSTKSFTVIFQNQNLFDSSIAAISHVLEQLLTKEELVPINKNLFERLKKEKSFPKAVLIRFSQKIQLSNSSISPNNTDVLRSLLERGEKTLSLSRFSDPLFVLPFLFYSIQIYPPIEELELDDFKKVKLFEFIMPTVPALSHFRHIIFNSHNNKKFSEFLNSFSQFCYKTSAFSFKNMQFTLKDLQSLVNFIKQTKRTNNLISLSFINTQMLKQNSLLSPQSSPKSQRSISSSSPKSKNSTSEWVNNTSNEEYGDEFYFAETEESRKFFDCEFFNTEIKDTLKCLRFIDIKKLSFDLPFLLKNLTYLQVLSLENCDIEIDFALKELQKNKMNKLRVLDLSGNKCRHFSLTETISLPKNLFSFICNNVQWSSNTLKNLFQIMFAYKTKSDQKTLVWVNKITKISFANAVFVDKPEEDWFNISNYLKKCKYNKLKAITWNNNEVNEDIMSFIQRNTKLEYLSMCGCFHAFKTKKAALLVQYLKTKPRFLNALILRGNTTSYLGKLSPTILQTAISECKFLSHIDISKNQIGDRGLEVISQIISTKTSLRSINFDEQESPFTEQFIKTLTIASEQNYVQVSFPFKDLDSYVLKNQINKEKANSLINMFRKKPKYQKHNNFLDEKSSFYSPFYIYSETYTSDFPSFITEEESKALAVINDDESYDSVSISSYSEEEHKNQKKTIHGKKTEEKYYEDNDYNEDESDFMSDENAWRNNDAYSIKLPQRKRQRNPKAKQEQNSPQTERKEPEKRGKMVVKSLIYQGISNSESSEASFPPEEINYNKPKTRERNTPKFSDEIQYSTGKTQKSNERTPQFNHKKEEYYEQHDKNEKLQTPQERIDKKKRRHDRHRRDLVNSTTITSPVIQQQQISPTNHSREQYTEDELLPPPNTSPKSSPKNKLSSSPHGSNQRSSPGSPHSPNGLKSTQSAAQIILANKQEPLFSDETSSSNLTLEDQAMRREIAQQQQQNYSPKRKQIREIDERRRKRTNDFESSSSSLDFGNIPQTITTNKPKQITTEPQEEEITPPRVRRKKKITFETRNKHQSYQPHSPTGEVVPQTFTEKNYDSTEHEKPGKYSHTKRKLEITKQISVQQIGSSDDYVSKPSNPLSLSSVVHISSQNDLQNIEYSSSTNNSSSQEVEKPQNTKQKQAESGDSDSYSNYYSSLYSSSSSSSLPSVEELSETAKFDKFNSISEELMKEEKEEIIEHEIPQIQQISPTYSNRNEQYDNNEGEVESLRMLSKQKRRKKKRNQ